MKQLVAGFAAAATFAVSASAMAGGPIRLTDAQMDRVVAGATFELDPVVTTESYYGYSNNIAPEGAPGTSSVETTTTTTLDCPGAFSSCYTGTGALNPNTTLTIETTTETLSGPGASFDVRF
jgi:hypothetical protein